MAGAGLAFPTGAAADPCGTRGTLPGSPRTTITIGSGDAEPYRTLYVDDRNLELLDDTDSEDGGSVWIYAESNHWAGLQRGARHALTPYFPSPREIDPIVVIPPDPHRPVLKQGLVLFPGGGMTPDLEWRDDCMEFGRPGGASAPDTLLF